jgi:hypothetical protein
VKNLAKKKSVIYDSGMKHNLNAGAIAGLSQELVSVQTNVDRLVRDMESAIAQADAFIASLEAE